MKKIYVLLFTVLCATFLQAQTTLIDPAGGGGFEAGATFATNGWTVVNHTTNTWQVGGASVPFAGTKAAFVSNDNGITNAYTITSSNTSHFYRDVAFPAGESTITLSFQLKGNGESLYDRLLVYTAPTTVTPVVGIPASNSTILTGATLVYTQTVFPISAYTTQTVSLPSSFAGTTARLIFTWQNDLSGGGNPPASVDNISLITRNPMTITSTAIGGLYSSPATWVGGVVPNGDDAVIADGATVTVDQVVNVRDLTVGGGTSGILNWNATANQITASRNVLINSGANMNMYSAVSLPVGMLFFVGGNFTNNGTVHAGYSNASILFNEAASSPTLGGTGTFVGNIIHQLQFITTGSCAITTASNISIRGFGHFAGSLNTNGKLTIDNTAQIFGLPLNQQVYSISMTSMGAGYTSAPTVTIAAPNSGTTATATANFDLATGTVRSITITNSGSGYIINPAVTFTGGGFTTTASSIAVVPAYTIGSSISATQKSGQATITGGINIKSDQAVGGITTSNGGVGYAAAPLVGFALPTTYLNLMTAGGTGYTSLPTVTVSGGTQLALGTAPTFTVIVASGQVVSVVATGGGTLWTSLPTLTLAGGGGSGATAAYPNNCLPTATVSIANGAVNNFTITNAGFGYSAAPAVGLVGTATTVATTPTCRIGLYNLTLGYFAPATANVVHTETGVVPVNRRINLLTMNSALGANFSGSDIDLYASAPLTLTSGIFNVSTNTLYGSSLAYAGQLGSITSSVAGNIKLNTPGGSLIRTFPYDATFSVNTGTGSLTTGSTIQTITAYRTGAPSGTVSPSGTPTGLRAYRAVTNTGAVYGSQPTVTLNYNANDNLAADQASLFVSQAAALTGPWAVRSVSTGTGALTPSGSRITGTVAPTLIVPTGDDYFAFTSTQTVIQSVASGNWNAPSTWNTGIVPVCADNVYINNTHNVTIASTGNVSASVTIQAGGTLTSTSGDLTVGCTLNNSLLIANGTLTVNGGTLNINGGVTIASSAAFNMGGGTINIDPNDGTAAGSYTNTNGTFYINTGTLNVTGGNINLLDPAFPVGQRILAYNTISADAAFGTGNTVTLGGGTHTNVLNTSGFSVESNLNVGTLELGTLVVNTGRFSAGRHVSTFSSPSFITKSRNLTINAGSELVINSAPLAITGNLVNNGFITSGVTGPGPLAMVGDAQYVSGVVFSPSATAQSITGSGFFKKSTADPDPTAQTGNLISQFSVFHSTTSPGVTLGMPITVTGTLRLYDGKVNTNATNFLALGNGTSVPGNTTVLTASAGSLQNFAGIPILSSAYAQGGWVSGTFKRYVLAATSTGNAGLMPVGSSAARPAQVIFTTAPTAAGYLAAQWFDADPGTTGLPLPEPAVTPSTIDQASVGYWSVVNEGTITGGTYTARFTNTAATNILDFNNITLLKRSSIAGSSWLLEGTHVATGGSNVAPTLSRTGLISFSEFGIGGKANSALTVKIDYFRGSKVGGANYLDWKVTCASEPSVRLVLERSADSRNFKSIQDQTATAVRCLQSFNYTDAAPIAGINYYRLKTISPDGAFKYSVIVALLNKEKGFELISVAPNPVKNNAILTLTSVKGGKMNVIVSDATGKVIMIQSLTVIAGNNPIEMNFASLKAGTYNIKVINADNEIKSTRFVKY